MGTKLVVNERNRLQEINETGTPEQPVILQWGATFFSYLFHPVFVPVYLVIFMVYLHPYLFAGFSPIDKLRTVVMSFLMFTFFPLVTVGLLKALKFIESIHLHTQKDRVIPLVACGIWYFWIWNVWRNLPDYPSIAVQFALATWISAFLALMANIIMKVSLHSIAMGVMNAFITSLALSQDLNFGIYLSLCLFVTGLVCTARFIVSDHSAWEIYGGLAAGILSFLVAKIAS
jgi:hypothetical protein